MLPGILRTEKPSFFKILAAMLARKPHPQKLRLRRKKRLPLPQPTVAALRRYVDEGRPVLLGAGEDPGSLFLTRFGGALDRVSLRLLVQRVGERAGVAVFPHLFRRTLATELAYRKVSLPAIQKILGHASLSVTSEYVSVGDEQMRDALEESVGRRPERPEALPDRVHLQRRLFGGWQASAA